jgi:hypothetical protein
LKRALALAALALGLGACTGNDAGTVVDVKVELSYRAVEGLVTVLRTTVSDPNHTAYRDFTRAHSVPLEFPVSFGIELASDVTGPLKIVVEGVDAAGIVRATGTIPMQKITRGKVTRTMLWLACDKDCPGDAGVDGGDVDARADAEPPEAGVACGNGHVDPGETCDTAIARGQPGACPPATCDDLLACTHDQHSGSGCTATCDHQPITETAPNDGCCPANATHLTDPDCSATCGDGIIDPGEFCDTGVTAGAPTACPVATDCPDMNSCTSDLLLSANTCNAICAHRDITALVSGDGCCPSGATHRTDSDCPVVCGNGMVEEGEACDTAIPAGMTGACPVTCPRQGSCLEEVIDGSGCKAVCRSIPITEFASGDGCCPKGGNRALDPDCPGVCGNGVFEPGEVCDKAIPAGAQGACPTACAAEPGGCMPRSLQGKLDDCTIHCAPTPVTTCSAMTDGCCPSGCSSANDPDCSSTCGNGVVEINETCDSAIPQGMKGSCPRGCDDGDACTSEVLVSKDTCNARCMIAPVVMFTPGDGCCPKGGNHNLDNDCPASCGNGAVEGPGETCDPAIPLGSPGACPTGCPAPSDCKELTLAGEAGLCTARCEPSPIEDCVPGDGCCPMGCTHDNDTDCPAVCGNAVVDSGESCDKGITAGNTGACLASCDDGKACTMDSTSGKVEDCTRNCSHAPVTACAAGDHCCPAGCNPVTDSDCLPICGNGVVENNETCDPASSCPTTCPDDGDPCTQEKLSGRAEDCDAVCLHLPILTCSGSVADQCCPTPGCSARQDSAKFDTDCAGSNLPPPGP